MSQIMLANISCVCNCYKIVNQIPAQPDGKDANLLIHCNRTQLIQPHISRSRELKHVQLRKKKSRTDSERNANEVQFQQVTSKEVILLLN